MRIIKKNAVMTIPRQWWRRKLVCRMLPLCERVWSFSSKIFRCDFFFSFEKNGFYSLNTDNAAIRRNRRDNAERLQNKNDLCFLGKNSNKKLLSTDDRKSMNCWCIRCFDKEIRRRSFHKDEFCLLKRKFSFSFDFSNEKISSSFLRCRNAVKTTLKPAPLTFPPSELKNIFSFEKKTKQRLLSTNEKCAVTMPLVEIR